MHFWDAGLLDDDSLAGGVRSQVLSYFHSIAITITIVKLWLTLSMTAGLICVKEVPQAPQLPNLHPWQPGRAPASCLQQPGGHHYHYRYNHGSVDDEDNKEQLNTKVRSSELSGDAVETKKLLR